MSADDTEHLLFSSLLPAARLATRKLMPLREMKRLVELAYYREARVRKLRMREIRDLLSVSMSKVSLLSRDLKAKFAEPEQAYELPRRILALLWAAPLSEKRIAQVFDDVDPAEIAEALGGLVQEGRIQEKPGRTVVRYRLSAQRYRLVQDGWMARIDALNDLMRSVSRVVEARFIEKDDRAFSRTVHFRAKPKAIERLRAAYEQVFELIGELDAEVEGDDESVPLSLSFLFAPEED